MQRFVQYQYNYSKTVKPGERFKFNLISKYYLIEKRIGDIF